MEPTSVGSLAVWRHEVKNPKARVLLIHGINEHSGRHLNTVEYLVANGYEVVRFDLRGSGRSGGTRQWIDTFDDYVSDAAEVHNWIFRTLPRYPQFVLGHSLGGAIGFYFVQAYQKELVGYVASAPAHIPGGSYPKWFITAGSLLSYALPKLALKARSDSSWVSRDPKVAETYEKDPLSFRVNTLQQGREVIAAIEKVPEVASHVEIPVLLAHGTDDQIVRFEGSFEILQKLKSRDKELWVSPGGYHELHNDLNKEEYFRKVVHWLDIRVSKEI